MSNKKICGLKLPVGTDVFLIRESTGEAGRLWIVKSGRKKILKGVFAEHEISDWQKGQKL